MSEKPASRSSRIWDLLVNASSYPAMLWFPSYIPEEDLSRSRERVDDPEREEEPMAA